MEEVLVRYTAGASNLAEFGFMVNLHKRTFLTENAAILGLELNAVGFALSAKFMGNLHKATIPTDLKGLPGLVGNSRGRSVTGTAEIHDLWMAVCRE